MVNAAYNSGNFVSEFNWRNLPVNADGQRVISYTFAGENRIIHELARVEFTDEQKRAVLDTFRHFESVANVKFVEAANSGDANLDITRANIEGLAAPEVRVLGMASFPDGEYSVLIMDDDIFGGNYGSGSQWNSVFYHELGHAMGLTHPGGVGDNPDYNSLSTVMSYNHVLTPDGIYPRLQMYDIRALQDLYGANQQYNVGDTSYNFNGMESQQYTIWDGGGKDTIDSSSYSGDVNIKLTSNPESYSEIGSNRLWMAHGANIENGSVSSFFCKGIVLVLYFVYNKIKVSFSNV